jgi:hypothetical protein
MGTWKNLLIVSSLVTGLLLVFPRLLAGEYKIIENPKANMVEKEYVKLVKIKEIDEDLGKDEYLFKPVSLTVGANGNFYVYDLLQSKIYRFDKDCNFVNSFSGKGQGPGEITSTPFGQYCYIRTGRDGKLYVNDEYVHKIMMFDESGTFKNEFRLREVRFHNTLKAPVVDHNGRIFIPAVENGSVNLYGGNFEKIAAIAPEEELSIYLFKEPRLKFPYLNEMWDIDITKDSAILFYFRNSSNLYIYREGEKVKKISILPRDALENYERILEEIAKSGKISYGHMFSALFVDQDEPDKFYLTYVEELKGLHTIHQFDLGGRLLKVFYIEPDKKDNWPICWVRKNYQFYVVEVDEDGEFKVSIYI